LPPIQLTGQLKLYPKFEDQQVPYESNFTIH
jgi:hypothetical protein